METVRFALLSEVFGALAHPKRLEIIFALGQGEHTAGELGNVTGLSKANVSQHLKLLKACGVVYCDKRGTLCHYQLTSRKVLQTCESIRQLILEQIETTTEARKHLATVASFAKRRNRV